MDNALALWSPFCLHIVPKVDVNGLDVRVAMGSEILANRYIRTA